MAETKNIWNVVHCGIGFFLVFSSYCTCQNIVVEALDQHGFHLLGFYSVGMIYAFFAIGSLLCPPMVESIGAIKSMALGSFCYMIWVASCILPVTVQHTHTVFYAVWVILLITGAINGIGASILWVGQGKYIST